MNIFIEIHRIFLFMKRNLFTWHIGTDAMFF
uniref:Uncharacterized protein n=1 Tax=viral metagenome TaxID=1070528 RepID=A0A6C0EH08_9ZZZZ